MRWAATMGIDDLLAKLQREAGTPGTLERVGGVPAKALLLLGCTLGTPGTPQNSNTAEEAKTGHPRQAETWESLTRPYLSGVSEVSGVHASIGRFCAGTPGVTDGVSGVTARGELPTLADEPIERDTGRAGDDPDDRRFCTQCLNLRGGVCIIAKPGGLVSAIVGYRPALPNMLQRCAGYLPNARDTDQRTGGEIGRSR